MLERKKQTHKEIIEEYNNPDSEQSKALEELKKRNAERRTPVVYEVKQKRSNFGRGDDSPGVQLAKKMLESQRQTIKEVQEAFETNPELKKMLEDLKKENEERGTPVIS